ncbi:MAG: magnesium and cobalt exporter, family [Chthoniobacter sp.]|jgi:CBS domain containing-hemolysin-like protein|nr:magnesium and cobalt exporter, family [Chthoniobacter sp.]
MIWLAVALCCLVSFIFSGIEAGLLSMNRVRLRHRVKLRDRAAIVLNRLIAHPERLLVTVLMVTNLMNVFGLTLATQELVRLLGQKGYFVALAAALPIYLICLELLPKSLFRRFPYRAVAFLSTPLRIADVLLSPMHFVGEAVVRTLFRQRPPDQVKLFVAREDFKYLTIESERTGALGQVERQMIHNVVDFRGVTANQVMVPLEKVRGIPAQASVEELIARSQAENIERWPVLDAGGDINGLVHVFDLALDGRRRGVVETFQRRIIKVTAEEPAYSILRKMRASRTTLAAVIGPEGRSVGIVTWEDLIRRLVATAVA